MSSDGHHHQSASSPAPPDDVLWLPEFLCPISTRPMSDPVIVPSGQTYERNCVSALLESGQTQCYMNAESLLGDGHSASLIFNRSLQSAIRRFCHSYNLALPSSPSIEEARLCFANLLRPTAQLAPDSSSPLDPRPSAPSFEPRVIHSATNLKPDQVSAFTFLVSPRIPSGSHFDFANAEQGGDIPSRFTQRLLRPDVAEKEAAVHDLRQLTRTDLSCRSTLASDKSLLNALFELTTSRRLQAQSDSVATIVNLSLEKENKVQLVCAGAVVE